MKKVKSISNYQGIKAGEVYAVLYETEASYYLKSGEYNKSHFIDCISEASPCNDCNCANKDGGIKHDQDKPRMELIPPEAELALAKVLTYGAKKYDDDNWKLVEDKRYIGALKRHINAHMRGEIIDPETGFPHLWHVLANAAISVAKAEGKK